MRIEKFLTNFGYTTESKVSIFPFCIAFRSIVTHIYFVCKAVNTKIVLVVSKSPVVIPTGYACNYETIVLSVSEQIVLKILDLRPRVVVSCHAHSPF